MPPFYERPLGQTQGFFFCCAELGAATTYPTPRETRIFPATHYFCSIMLVSEAQLVAASSAVRHRPIMHLLSLAAGSVGSEVGGRTLWRRETWAM
jgi:hypothetical protein